MNLLFISYWPIEEGLTQSTVIPHIQILSHQKNVQKIILITIERGIKPIPSKITHKTIHIPLTSSSKIFGKLGQMIDFIFFPRLLRKYCIDYKIDKILAKGVLAGALAEKTYKLSAIPYFVESYEPHADYMAEAGTWNKLGLKYILMKRWELRQLQTSSGIITVSEAYSKYLRSLKSIEVKICTAPCAVDYEAFKFNEKDRSFIRKELGFREDTTVGIYVGKFGGLYYDISDLFFLVELINFFPAIGLIFLTPTPKNTLVEKLNSLLGTHIQVVIKEVPHKQVPTYLSGADFAFSFIRSFKSGIYNSPVKHGEYWANGLPILMTPGIGDESVFLEAERGGVLLREESLMESLVKLKELIEDPDHRKNIPKLARKYRSFDKVRETYEKLILSEPF